MIRTLLRTFKLLLSLASVGALLTTRGPLGEPSALERIPALMNALEARLAEGSTGPTVARLGPSRTSEPTRTTPTVTEAMRPAQGSSMVQEPGRASPERLAGQDGVKVNRGLP